MDKLKGTKSGKTTSYTAKFLASTTKETRFARSTTLLMSEKATTKSTSTKLIVTPIKPSKSVLPTRENSCTRSLMVRAA